MLADFTGTIGFAGIANDDTYSVTPHLTLTIGAASPQGGGVLVNDILGGTFGVVGALAALHDRHATGRGRHVRSRLFENNLLLVAQFIAQFQLTGSAPKPMGAERKPPWGVYDVFETADGRVFVAVVGDAQWRNFAQKFLPPEWAADPRLATAVDREAARSWLVPGVAVGGAAGYGLWFLRRMRNPVRRFAVMFVIAAAVESYGFETTGSILGLASYENRVYQIGIEGGFVVVKFYRPGRWSTEAILEEHDFALELAAQDIPVVPPLVHDGTSLHEQDGYRFAVYERRGGRWPARPA